MFEALVITLREGVEAALVLAIALSILKRRGLERRAGALWAGALVALLASVGIAALASRITYDEELAEGIAMLVGAALVLTLVVWMWRSASHFKEEIETGIGRATAAGSGFGLFLFAFGMVFREGVETAIFLSAAGFNSQGVALWLGALIGLTLAAVFGVLFVRGTLRVPLKPFFTLTSAVLVLIAIQLFVGGLHELSEAQVLPSSRAEMAIIGPFVKNELLLFAMTIALAAAWLLIAPSGAPPAAEPTSSPQARLERAARGRERAWRRGTGVIGLVVVALLTTAFAQQSRLPGKAPAKSVPLEGDAATVDVSDAHDGHIHFYEATTTKGTVRFFVIQVGSRLEACADACQICGDKGYFESGGAVVCRNCTSPIALNSLGRAGGCNPIALPHRIEGDRLSIAVSDLDAVIPHLKGK